MICIKYKLKKCSNRPCIEHHRTKGEMFPFCNIIDKRKHELCGWRQLCPDARFRYYTARVLEHIANARFSKLLGGHHGSGITKSD